MNRKRNGSLPLMITWGVLLSSMICLGSCSREINDSSEFPHVVREDYTNSNPTEDQLNVKSSLKTYIVEGEYQGVGRALVNRMTNRVGLTTSGMATIMLSNSDLTKISTELGDNIIKVLLDGGNIVIVSPKIKEFNIFCLTLGLIINQMYEDDQISAEKIQGAKATLSLLDNLVDGSSEPGAIFMDGNLSNEDSPLCEAIALRNNDFYIINTLNDPGKRTLTSTVVSTDESDVETVVSSEEKVADYRFSAYTYGLFADKLTEWLNQQPLAGEAAKARLKLGKTLMTRASGADDLDLDKIANSTAVTIITSAEMPLIKVKLPITVKLQMWSVYSTKHEKDYYCIHQEVRLENSKLDCGSQDKATWRFYPNNSYSTGNAGDQNGTCGPYMAKVIVDPTMDNGVTAEIEQASPNNSISGSTSYTEGFSYSIDGGLYISADPGVNIGGSVSFDKSWTTEIPDLDMRFQYTPLQWRYEGVRPTTYVTMGSILGSTLFGVPAQHTIVKPIMRTDCSLGQCWIWSVKNPKKSYSFTLNLSVDLEALSYYYKSTLYSNEVYFTENTKRQFSVQLPAPPRANQKWEMECVPYTPELYKFLSTLYPDQWYPSFTLAAEDEDDTKEIDSSIESFKLALERKKSFWIGANKQGSYTFRWKRANASDGEYYETYVFNVTKE